MKKLVFISFYLMFWSVLFGQNNLQFNRAVLINISGTQAPTAQTPTVIFKDTTITVPTGKVWKVESANVTLQFANPGSMGLQIAVLNTSGTAGTYLLLNNRILSKNEVSTYPDYNDDIKFPIWLPQGNYPVRLMGQLSNLYNNYTCFGGISILEFNLVQ